MNSIYADRPKLIRLLRHWRGTAAVFIVLGNAYATEPVSIRTDELKTARAHLPAETVSCSINGDSNPEIGRLDLETGLTIDPITYELDMQRAIATALQGDTATAIEMLADVDDTAALFARAMWLLDNGEVEEGAAILESIAGRPDAPPETKKFLAVAYLHLDRAADSELAVDEYLLSCDDPYAHYVKGMAILQQDDPQRASVELTLAGYSDDEVNKIQLVAMQNPVDAAQRRLTIGSSLGSPITNGQNLSRRDGGCDSMGGDSKAQKIYNFTLLFAGEYDSNVLLQPRFSGLGSDIDHEDYRALVASFLDVQLLTGDDFNLGLVSSTYNTFQFEADEFNIQDYMGGGYANQLLHEDLMGSFRYEYHHTLVDGSRFSSEHRLTPSLTLLGERGHTTLFYEFNPIDNLAPALIPSQLQSADVNRVGLTQAIYTYGGEGRIYGGYQFADADAEGSDFDRESHMVTGRIEQPLPRGWIADLDVRYVWDNYENGNSLDFYNRDRKDGRVEVRTGLQKNFTRPVSLRFDYTYINNDSNTENLFGVRFYDYDRHIFSTQLIFTL